MYCYLCFLLSKNQKHYYNINYKHKIVSYTLSITICLHFFKEFPHQCTSHRQLLQCATQKKPSAEKKMPELSSYYMMKEDCWLSRTTIASHYTILEIGGKKNSIKTASKDLLQVGHVLFDLPLMQCRVTKLRDRTNSASLALLQCPWCSSGGVPAFKHPSKYCHVSLSATWIIIMISTNKGMNSRKYTLSGVCMFFTNWNCR